ESGRPQRGGDHGRSREPDRDLGVRALALDARLHGGLVRLHDRSALRAPARQARGDPRAGRAPRPRARRAPAEVSGARVTAAGVFPDPPDHTRIRRLFAPAFTPKALAALEPRVVRFVDGLLDRAAARGGMDVVDDFAAALPVQLIGDMLGVPQAERAPLRAWSLAILGALEPEPGPERLEAGSRA